MSVFAVVSVGFTEEESVVNEADNITVCVEICEGTPKRNVSIYVNFFNGTANGDFLNVSRDVTIISVHSYHFYSTCSWYGLRW